MYKEDKNTELKSVLTKGIKNEIDSFANFYNLVLI